MAFLGNLPTEVYKSLAKQTITGDGSTSYALDHNVGSAVDLEVFVNNVRQEPEVAYTASGASITFTTALEALDECYVIYQGKAISSNLIESQNIADGAITAGKLADSYEPTIARSGTAPSNPTAGDLWYNTSENVMKHYTGSEWLQMSNKFAATGGTVTSDGTYKYHTFTSSDTFTAEGTGTVDVLIVAGGGAGGGGSQKSSNGQANTGGGAGGCGSHGPGGSGGGGGAGGVVWQSSITVTGSQSIVVGSGGTSNTNASGASGSNSSALGYTAIGGGGGGSYTGSANGWGPGAYSGGSGGGADGNNQTGGSGTSGQGFAGGNANHYSGPNYAAAGGGGAGAAGQNSQSSTNGGAGGIGTANPIGNTTQSQSMFSTTSIGDYVNGLYYVAGGGSAINATRGYGGGTQGNTGTGSGNGGSGVVIIRYAI